MDIYKKATMTELYDLYKTANRYHQELPTALTQEILNAIRTELENRTKAEKAGN